jgi:type II secretory pathway component GspD/PulD (secretin)
MKKAFFPAILPAFLLFSLAVAADTRVTEVHPLGLATADTAYELVQGLVSPAGRAVLDEGHNAIIVLDAPETQQAVRELLQGLQTPLPQIRIESRIVDNESGRPGKVSASGQLVASVPPGEASGSVFFNVGDGSTSSSRAAEQFVVVASGGEAFISVGKEIPYLEWFAAYGEGLGILTPGIEWREVGSRLEVKATAIDGGRKVRLRAVPQLEYLVGGTRKRKGRRQETAFAGVEG